MGAYSSRWGRRPPPYSEAMDAMDAGIVLFDAQDRLVRAPEYKVTAVRVERRA